MLTFEVSCVADALRTLAHMRLAYMQAFHLFVIVNLVLLHIKQFFCLFWKIKSDYRALTVYNLHAKQMHMPNRSADTLKTYQ